MCMLYPIEGRPANPLGKFYRADHRCAYHSGAVGHDTENCSTLKHKIQNMINNNLINIEENHLSGWHIGCSRVSARHFWTESFEDSHSRRRMPNIGKTLHMKFCYLPFENVSHIYNELRLTWILKNEIRWRPLSASVTPFSPLIFLCI